MDTKSDKPGTPLRLVGQYQPETVNAHLAACEEITRRGSAVILDRFFPALGERLRAFADRAGSNAERRRFDDLLSLLVIGRQDLVESFHRSLSQGFQRFGKRQLNTQIAETTTNQDRLALVDDDVLEESIALSSISYRCEEDYRTDLWFLNQRLSALNGGMKVQGSNSPISALQFCHALRTTIAPHAIPIREKLLAYKVFEGALNESYRDLLIELNEYLAEQGILPNLRLLEGGRRDSAGVGSATGAEMPPGTQGPPESETSASAEPAEQDLGVMQAIRALQRYSLDGTEPLGEGVIESDARVAVDHPHQEQLLAALQAVQTQALSDQDSLENVPAAAVVLPEAGNLGQGIAEKLQDEKVDGQLDPSDMHTIDLVGMLFEYMLSDEQLPDSVKAVLSYLHTPFLKIAFQDANFFEHKEHPARLLLNALAEAGTRWVGNDGTSQYDMFAKIKEVVSTVLKKFENDVRLFADLLLDFGAHVKKIARRQDLMEKRATERFQGEEKLREVKARVSQEVRRRTDGRELPSAVLLLLLQPWSDYLAFLLLRYGDSSAAWKEALQAVDEILLSVQPPPDSTDRHRARQARVLSIVQQGLNTIGYDPNRGEKITEALSSLQENALQRNKPAAAPVRPKVDIAAADIPGVDIRGFESTPEQASSGPAPETISAEERKMVENLKLIEFGTWFEFEGGKRLKVAWYSSRTEHYMLVDQMGRQQATTSGLELARAMLTGKARVIAGSTKPFFERALENILQDLNAKASQTEHDHD